MNRSCPGAFASASLLVTGLRHVGWAAPASTNPRVRGDEEGAALAAAQHHHHICGVQTTMPLHRGRQSNSPAASPGAVMRALPGLR